MINNQEETGKVVYADYYTVIPQIQYYYYGLLRLWQKYYIYRLKKKKDHNTLMIYIQGYIVTLHDMFRHYDNIKAKKELDKIFNIIKLFEEKNVKMSYKALLECKNAIIQAHFVLGLSNIERDKKVEFNPMEPTEDWTKWKG